MKQTIMNNTAKTTTIFKKIFAAITAEKSKQLDQFVADLNEKNDVKEILSAWYYDQLLPKGKKTANWELNDLKEYLIARQTKVNDKSLQKQLAHLQTVEQSPDLKSITVSVEWKKSRMWGNNPSAEARVCVKDNYEYYESGSIGGCGYDKGSTAVAMAINQSNSFLKAMYQHKEKNVATNNRELFGYGSGYGILPRLEGGVGVSCYPKIFETIGFKFSNTASGKTFDVYTVTK